jgi:hypothetical protein
MYKNQFNIHPTYLHLLIIEEAAMKSLCIFCIGFILLNAPELFSQFVVTSSSPADGAVSVPLSTTISFTFSAPLDTTLRYGESQFPISLLAADPHDSLDFGAISYSPDLQTISFMMTHTDKTDFVWLIMGARSSSGQPLAKPYALNYTTATAHGSHTVSGMVAFPGLDSENALVALLDRPPFGEDESITLIGTVVPDSHIYIANNVCDGIYWPITAKDVDHDGEFNPMGKDALGFYDPNEDGQPDSIVVSGDNLTGIDMVLKVLFVPVTARTYLDTATVIAKEFVPDQEFRGIGVHADPKGIDIGLDGTALMWAYQFYSPSMQFPTMVLTSSYFIMTDTTMEGFPSIGKSIPEDFVDSDVVMSVADANGGHDFEAQHNVVRRTLYGGNMWSERFLQDSTQVIWVAEYESMEPDCSSIIFRVFVDMITGEITTNIQEPAAIIPSGYSLSQNYPNPFNPVTTINYQLITDSDVNLSVYDLSGKLVEILINEYVPTGYHTVEWDASNQPSGVYLYQIQAGDFTDIKKCILLK